MNHKSKVEKLENLKKEVQDFHPILHELFKRMKSFNIVVESNKWYNKTLKADKRQWHTHKIIGK